jgi:hypothetical protein
MSVTWLFAFFAAGLISGFVRRFAGFVLSLGEGGEQN